MMLTPRVEIVPAEHKHVQVLGERLRSADVAEVESAGLGPMNALWRSYRRSHIASVVIVDGEIAAMWGCGGSPFSGVGMPWLLTSAHIERIPVTFVRQAVAEVAAMLFVYHRLWGYVAEGYPRAQRLLRIIGFTLGEPFPFGEIGALFRKYEMVR